ncbi:MAG: hypothetical protein KA214_09380 [Neisseriaceae bacterium]|nr:hypothetical protein [Neisseriaceae bacterium]
MNINQKTGYLTLSSHLEVGPGLSASDLLQTHRHWEEWVSVDSERVSAYRLIFSLDGETVVGKIYFTAYFLKDSGLMSGWTLSANQFLEKARSRTKGKLKKWFVQNCEGASLPMEEVWGRLSVEYDARNETVFILCQYA